MCVRHKHMWALLCKLNLPVCLSFGLYVWEHDYRRIKGRITTEHTGSIGQESKHTVFDWGRIQKCLLILLSFFDVSFSVIALRLINESLWRTSSMLRGLIFMSVFKINIWISWHDSCCTRLNLICILQELHFYFGSWSWHPELIHQFGWKKHELGISVCWVCFSFSIPCLIPCWDELLSDYFTSYRP